MQMLDGFSDYASHKATFLDFSYTLTKFVDFTLCTAHMSQHCGALWVYVG
jgi:hypothetical protein